MTLDRAALREIAQRLKTESAYPSPSPRWYEDVGRIADYVIAIAAPLLVKCENCGGKGYIPDPWPESKTGWDCPACHGKGSVEREDIAAIRKRWEASGRAAGVWQKGLAGSFNLVSYDGDDVVGIALLRATDPVWDFITAAHQDIPALLDLVAAQAREIAELKGKANG